ncbi:hypothetical protein [Planobispora longispora]|nr:hypothetical protein [Planobispora longispora]
MSEIDELHGPHAATRQANADRIVWREADRRFARIRVTRHTCECRARIFELCAAGGLGWIRLTDRLGEGKTTVLETDALPMRQAEELWWKVLFGQAR